MISILSFHTDSLHLQKDGTLEPGMLLTCWSCESHVESQLVIQQAHQSAWLWTTYKVKSSRALLLRQSFRSSLTASRVKTGNGCEDSICQNYGSLHQASMVQLTSLIAVGHMPFAGMPRSSKVYVLTGGLWHRWILGSKTALLGRRRPGAGSYVTPEMPEAVEGSTRGSL